MYNQCFCLLLNMARGEGGVYLKIWHNHHILTFKYVYIFYTVRKNERPAVQCSTFFFAICVFKKMTVYTKKRGLGDESLIRWKYMYAAHVLCVGLLLFSWNVLESDACVTVHGMWNELSFVYWVNTPLVTSSANFCWLNISFFYITKKKRNTDPLYLKCIEVLKYDTIIWRILYW